MGFCSPEQYRRFLEHCSAIEKYFVDVGIILIKYWMEVGKEEQQRRFEAAREAAKKDQLQAKHRLGKFLLRHGRRPPTGVKPWTLKYLTWVKQGVHFEQPAQEATLLDYLHEVEHAEARIARLNLAIEEAVKSMPPEMKAVIEGLQALRGIAQVAAVTIVAELGEISRFSRARQLMGYGGIVASEHSSGESNWRGGITKTGNAHLRRVVVEAAWAYRHRPNVGAALRQRQDLVSEEVREIAWKAQHRLYIRYRKLMARGKDKGKVITAIGRELLGFIWAIGVKAEAAQKATERRAA